MRRIIYSRLVLIVLVAVILFLLQAVGGVYRRSQAVQTDKQHLAASLAELQARQKELTGDTKKLETPAGVEAEIREKFSVVKEGERVIVVVENEKKSVATTSAGVGWWKKIFK